MAVQVRRGHAVTELQALARERPKSVAAICTSPPYFRCRKYGGEPQIWPNPDGTPLCPGGAHEWGDAARSAVRLRNGRGSTLPGMGTPKTLAVHELNPAGGQTCARCGAFLGELGWEDTVDEYVAHLVQVFDAARGVLRDDGSLWVNLASGYANEAGGQNGSTGGVSARAMEANRQAGRTDKTGGLPKLNYLDVPGLFGRAMQAAGWIWRADVSLVKRAPQPESVTGWRWEKCRVKVAPSRLAETGSHHAEAHPTPFGARNGKDFDSQAEWESCPGCKRCESHDGLILRRGAWRPTRATEALMLFVKQEKYWSDAEAVKVPASQPIGVPKLTGQLKRAAIQRLTASTLGTNQGAATRNAWDWMEWPTSGGGFAGAHYAAYPPDLPAWCIKASVPERACSVCGAGWARIVERKAMQIARSGRAAASGVRTMSSGTMQEPPETVTLGWKATCGHDAPPVPGEALDMFGGAGTTGLAAERLGRNCTLIDINPTYTTMQADRITADAPLLAAVSVAAPSPESESPPGRQLALFAEAGE